MTDTTRVCIKTYYYVRDRSREVRLVTKTYMVPRLQHDLPWGEALNKAGYRIILDADNYEAGVFEVKKN